MNIKLIRLEESDDGTFGALVIGGKVFCVTLEPPDEGNQRNISNIPPYKYICVRIKSLKYGNTFEVTNVPGRSHILFHRGNEVKDTKGCILLGNQFGKLRSERAILNSGFTFSMFMNMMTNVDAFELEIVEI